MIGLAAGQQRAHDGLGHQHHHAAFQAVAGDVADADLDPPLVLQHVVVVAADLERGLHVAGDFQALDLLQFFARGQQHHLQAPGHVQFAFHALVVAAQRLVQRGDLGMGPVQLGLAALQFGDVGVGGDHAARCGEALAHPHPAAIGAVLHVRPGGVAVALEPLGQPGLAVARVLDDATARPPSRRCARSGVPGVTVSGP